MIIIVAFLLGFGYASFIIYDDYRDKLERCQRAKTNIIQELENKTLNIKNCIKGYPDKEADSE